MSVKIKLGHTNTHTYIIYKLNTIIMMIDKPFNYVSRHAEEKEEKRMENDSRNPFACDYIKIIQFVLYYCSV